MKKDIARALHERIAPLERDNRERVLRDYTPVAADSSGTPGDQGEPGPAGNPIKYFRLLMPRLVADPPTSFTARELVPATMEDTDPATNITIRDEGKHCFGWGESAEGTGSAIGWAQQDADGDWHAAHLDGLAPVTWLQIVRNATDDIGDGVTADNTIRAATIGTYRHMRLHGHVQNPDVLAEDYTTYQQGVGLGTGQAIPVPDPEGILRGLPAGHNFLAALFRDGSGAHYEPIAGDELVAIAKLTANIDSGTASTSDFTGFQVLNYKGTIPTPAELQNDGPATISSGTWVRVMLAADGQWNIVETLPFTDRDVALDAADDMPGGLLSKLNIPLDVAPLADYFQVRGVRTGDTVALYAKDENDGGGVGTDELVGLNASTPTGQYLEDLIANTITAETPGSPGEPELLIERTAGNTLRFVGASSYTPCWVVSAVAEAQIAGGVITCSTVSVKRHLLGAGPDERVASANVETAYWDRPNEGWSLGTGKARLGLLAQTTLGTLDLIWVDCQEFDAP